jgi:putative oxidoreductase
MYILEFLGRIFLSALFLIAGTNKIIYFDGTIDYMESFNLPGYLAIPAILIEILFPLLIILGYKTKISALIMAVFTIALAIIFHTDFANQMQLMSFLKNFAIAGGFMIIFVNGPGKYSIDYQFEKK